MHKIATRLILMTSLLASAAGLTAAAPRTSPATPPQAAAKSPTSVAMDWQDELVDKLGSVGQDSSVALDERGYPHIAYYDETQKGIKYAAWDGTAWTLDTVERDLLQSNVLSDSHPVRSGIGYYSGSAYIVYQKYDAQTGAHYLRYAQGGPGNWSISTIGQVFTYTVEYAPALRMDPNHNLHLSYTLRDRRDTSSAPDQVIYARSDYTGTGWVVQPATARLCCYVSLVTSLAVGPANQPQIAYGDDLQIGNSKLGLVRWNAGSWLTQTVTGGGSQPSLAVDQAGNPHLAYVNVSNYPFTQLGYATLSGSTWLTQTPTVCGCGSAPSIALDAHNHPHIAINQAGLQVVWWDGATWHSDSLPQTSTQPQDPMLALDSAGNAHLSYFDDHYQDLHHVAWGPNWNMQTVALAGSHPSLAVDQHANPYISYQDNHLELAHWAPPDDWQYQTAAPSGNYNSLQLQYGADQKPLPIISYQDGGLQSDLAEWTGTAFVSETVDHANNTGYDGSLALNGPNPAVAFFERTGNQLEYADLTPSGWAIRNDTAQPASNAQSGAQALSLGVAPNCCKSYIAYRDGVSQTLRMALWDGSSWTDQVVDGNGDTGLHASLAVDRATGDPAIAYFDATHHTLKYAIWHNHWISDTVDDLLQDVSGVSLQLGMGSSQYPRIAYSVKADNSLRLAWTTALTGTWNIETVGTFSGNPPPDVSSRVQQRDHIAFSFPAGGIGYAARAATLPNNLDYNPLQPCVEDQPAFAEYGQALAQVQAQVKVHGPAAATQLDDLSTLRALRDLFAISPGGQHYISLYYQFGFQTGSLAVADPSLAWDGYRTLQNFMPGAQALIAGQGDQVTITQAMVDQANNIFDRLAAAGTPSLHDAITLERGKYNHLQAFAGKTFAQAATLMSVAAYGVYMPLLEK